MTRWRYSKNAGPPSDLVSESELLALIRTGELGPRDAVRSEAQQDWRPVSDIAYLLLLRASGDGGPAAPAAAAAGLGPGPAAPPPQPIALAVEPPPSSAPAARFGAVPSALPPPPPPLGGVAPPPPSWAAPSAPPRRPAPPVGIGTASGAAGDGGGGPVAAVATTRADLTPAWAKRSPAGVPPQSSASGLRAAPGGAAPRPPAGDGDRFADAQAHAADASPRAVKLILAGGAVAAVAAAGVVYVVVKRLSAGPTTNPLPTAVQPLPPIAPRAATAPARPNGTAGQPAAATALAIVVANRPPANVRTGQPLTLGNSEAAERYPGVRFTWTQRPGGPRVLPDVRDGAVLTIDPLPRAAAGATLTFEVAAEAFGERPVKEAVTVTVDNAAPRLEASRVDGPPNGSTVELSKPVRLDATGAVDEDDGPDLKYAWTVDGQVVGGNAPTLDWSPRKEGRAVVRLSVSDGGAAQPPRDVRTFTVARPSQPELEPPPVKPSTPEPPRPTPVAAERFVAATEEVVGRQDADNTVPPLFLLWHTLGGAGVIEKAADWDQVVAANVKLELELDAAAQARFKEQVSLAPAKNQPGAFHLVWKNKQEFSQAELATLAVSSSGPLLRVTNVNVPSLTPPALVAVNGARVRVVEGGKRTVGEFRLFGVRDGDRAVRIAQDVVAKRKEAASHAAASAGRGADDLRAAGEKKKALEKDGKAEAKALREADAAVKEAAGRLDRAREKERVAREAEKAADREAELVRKSVDDLKAKYAAALAGGK